MAIDCCSERRGFFPDRTYDRPGAFWRDYLDEYHRAGSQLDHDALALAVGIVKQAFDAGRTLYVCGNGGSAAISNHMTCDVMKGVQTDTDLHSRIVSLSSTTELITAIANDIEYAEVFAFQLKSLAHAGDVLITVSSSGNSENIVRALQWAKQNGVRSIAMTGFEGGRSARLADVNLHVPSRNYGVVEDLHQSLVHLLSQYLRLQHMPAALVGQRVF